MCFYPLTVLTQWRNLVLIFRASHHPCRSSSPHLTMRADSWWTLLLMLLVNCCTANHCGQKSNCLRCISAKVFNLRKYCNTPIMFPQYPFPAAGTWQMHDSSWWKWAELPLNESSSGVSLSHLCISCRPSHCSSTGAIKYSSKAELNSSTLVYNPSFPVCLHQNLA